MRSGSNTTSSAHTAAAATGCRRNIAPGFWAKLQAPARPAKPGLPSARSLPARPTLPTTLNPTHNPPRLSPEVVHNRESGHRIVSPVSRNGRIVIEDTAGRAAGRRAGRTFRRRLPPDRLLGWRTGILDRGERAAFARRRLRSSRRGGITLKSRCLTSSGLRCDCCHRDCRDRPPTILRREAGIGRIAQFLSGYLRQRALPAAGRSGGLEAWATT